MAGIVFPVDAVSGAPAFTGRNLRDALSVLLSAATSARPMGCLSGVRVGTPSSIVTATATTWTVTPHAGAIDAETANVAGGYLYAFDANKTGSIAAADGTNPRIDLISVQVSDPAEGDGTASPIVDVVYTVGTPGASPSAPATPARSLALAQITVPPTGGGSPSVTWVAPAAVAAGGILPAGSSSQYPPTPYKGQYVDDASLGLMRWDGSEWQEFGLGGDTGWLTLPVGASYNTASTAQMRLKDGTVRMRGFVKLNSGASFPTNSTVAVINAGGLPLAFRPPSQANFILSGSNVAAAVRCIINGDGSMSFVTQATSGSYVDMVGARYDVA